MKMMNISKLELRTIRMKNLGENKKPLSKMKEFLFFFSIPINLWTRTSEA
jgi:hypothetical protein